MKICFWRLCGLLRPFKGPFKKPFKGPFKGPYTESSDLVSKEGNTASRFRFQIVILAKIPRTKTLMWCIGQHDKTNGPPSYLRGLFKSGFLEV